MRTLLFQFKFFPHRSHPVSSLGGRTINDFVTIFCIFKKNCSHLSLGSGSSNHCPNDSSLLSPEETLPGVGVGGDTCWGLSSLSSSGTLGQPPPHPAPTALGLSSSRPFSNERTCLNSPTGAQLASTVERVTHDLRVVSLTPTLGEEITLKN